VTVMSLDDDIVFFEQVPIFAALGRQALQVLAIGAETRHLANGAVLFYAGELAEGGYVVQDGALLIEPNSPLGGARFTAGPGTLLNEQALLHESVCSTTAIAKGPTVVVRIPRNLFRKVLEGYPVAARTLRDMVAGRVEAWMRDLDTVKKKLEKSN